MKRFIFKILILICLTTYFSSFAQDIAPGKKNYDAKIYKILVKELRAAEKLYKADPKISNGFRVFSTRVEILKFLKTKNIEDSLKNPNSPQIGQDLKMINNFYHNTKELAFKIDQDKNFPDRAKFHFLFGLTIYDFEEKNPLVAQYLLSAYANLDERELKHLSAGKLGDYYFNNGKYEESAKFYQEAGKLESNSEWTTRHLHNLGWCYFKLEDLDRALGYLNQLMAWAKTPEDKKDYFYQQALQKIPYFYLYNNEPEKGYLFIKKNKGISSPEIVAYIKEIYNKGFFDKVDAIVLDAEKGLGANNNAKELLAFQIEIYTHVSSQEYKKNYQMLSRLRRGVAKASEQNLLDAKRKEQFIQDNKYLLNQHLKQINSKSFEAIRNEDDKFVLNDSVEMLQILIQLDPQGSANYRLKLAQLYNKSGQREQALKMLWEDYLSYGGENNPEAGPYLAEILAVVDQMGDKAPPQNLEKIYQDYLKVGKDSNIRNVVYLKYFDLKFNRGDHKGALDLVKQHQTEFPGPSEDRKNMVVKLTNHSLKSKDKALFDQVRDHAKADVALNGNREIMKTLNTGHNSFLLEKVNKGLLDEKSDKLQASTKLAEIFRSNSIDRSNQLISGFNAGLIYANIGRTNESSVIFAEMIDQLNPAEYKEYHDKIATIADNQLLLGNEIYGIKTYQRLNQKNCQILKVASTTDVAKLMELYLVTSNDNGIMEQFSSSSKCPWNDEAKKNVYLLLQEYLPLEDVNKSRQFFKYFMLLKVNQRQEVEKNIEALYVLMLNRHETISPELSLGTLDQLEKGWLSPNGYSSDVTREIRQMLLKQKKTRMYQKERISPTSFAKYIEKNFDYFTANLAVYNELKTKFSTAYQFKVMFELNEMRKFLNFFNDADTLIDDQKNKVVYLDQIKEALNPIQAKLTEEEAKYQKFLQTEQTLLVHANWDDKFRIIPLPAKTFILDRL